MTAAPAPRQPANRTPRDLPPETTPVAALKELVASLYHEQNKIQNLLSSLGFALRSFNNLNQFLDLAPFMAARVTDADGGILIGFTAKGQLSIEQIHSQDTTLVQKLRQALDPLVRQSQSSDTPAIATQLDEQVRQALGVHLRIYNTPILVKNSERGRLYVLSTNPDYIWTQTRRKLLQLVADQAAVAIANNELAVELRAKERQDRELEIASEIQLRLLPRKCPQISGMDVAAHCQTANRVGGDYYDFIPTNYDRLPEGSDDASASAPWSIAIGDVMGKGVPAGLLMTMTRGMLRAEVLNRHSPARILQHLNQVMYADLDQSHRFVTLFYSEYDPKTRILSYSNAAHNPPLLWQAESKTIQRLDSEGMLIGLEADSEFEDARVQLDEGDVLLYYTDGLTDAANAKGDRFSESNLLRCFSEACECCTSAQAILDAVFDAVETFVGNENNNGDDMTLVVMRLKSSE